MKLIIDIPDTQYNNIMEVKSMSLGRIPYKGIIINAIKGIQNGTPIPDNATNGEIADMMFPDVNIGHRYWFPDSTIRFMDTDWWNAPYQKGGKE